MLSFVIVVFAGVLIVLMGLRQRSQQLEMRHRERMAIIEKGLLPADVERFLPDGPAMPTTTPRTPARRSLTFGIVLMAVGFGFMTVIGVAAGAPAVAIGLGSAVVIVGLAFIVISFVTRPSQWPPADSTPPRPPV
ncbi:MAG TPA: DUF6249 domain-containing protein [Vicinamibacterales bacterium]|nr:DUF6249 domain-containing protein [Vicinamibacterales bacterium]